MPLKPNVVYTIRNELTHTVLGLSEHNIPGCWGWHGKSSQQWKLIRVGDAGTHTWKLQNRDNNCLLSRGNGTGPLGGLIPDQGEVLVLVDTRPTANFVIKPIGETSEIYRIQFSNQSAVTLITGQGENAAGFPDERVFDLHADGTLLAHRGVPAEPHPIDSAQLWSFRPVVQSPLEPGTYKIISSHARLFLDLAEDGDADHHVRGLRGGGNDNPKWVVVRNDNGYTFKSSRPGAARPFLSAPAPNVAADSHVIGQAEANMNVQTFTIRNVPGTHLYKIFLQTNSKLAVNIGTNNKVLFRQEEAQMWAFELVQ